MMVESGRNREVEFQAVCPGASQVMLVGDLDERPACSLFMQNRGGDLWACRVRLEAGTHWFRYLLSSDATSESRWHTMLIQNHDDALDVVHLPGVGHGGALSAREFALIDCYRRLPSDQARLAVFDAMQEYSYM